MSHYSLRAASLVSAITLAGCTLPERDFPSPNSTLPSPGYNSYYETVLTRLGLKPGDQSPTPQEFRELLDTTTTAVRADIVLGLLPGVGDSRVEHLASSILRRCESLAELREMVNLIGRDALCAGMRPQLTDLVAHAANTERIEKLPLPNISQIPSSVDEIRQKLSLLENSCLEAIRISLEDPSLKQTTVVRDNLSTALYNLAYLAIEGEKVGESVPAQTELLKMMTIKIGIERRYGFHLSHSINRSEEMAWREKGIAGDTVLKLLDPTPIATENGTSQLLSDARRWKSNELLELQTVLDMATTTVLPRSAIVLSQGVRRFIRVGGDQYRRGLAFGGGIAEIYDGATDRLEPFLRTQVPVQTHIGRTVLHELVHLLTYADKEFEEFVTAQGGWKVYPTMATPSWRDGKQWIPLPGYGQVPLDTPTTSNGISRIFVLHLLQRTAYSYYAGAELPPEFEPDSGPAHITTHLVLQGLEHPEVLSTSEFWRGKVAAFWGTPGKK